MQMDLSGKSLNVSVAIHLQRVGNSHMHIVGCSLVAREIT